MTVMAMLLTNWMPQPATGEPPALQRHLRFLHAGVVILFLLCSGIGVTIQSDIEVDN